VSNDSGVVENGDFCSICRHISNTVHFKEKVTTGNRILAIEWCHVQ